MRSCTQLQKQHHCQITQRVTIGGGFTTNGGDEFRMLNLQVARPGMLFLVIG